MKSDKKISTSLKTAILDQAKKVKKKRTRRKKA